MLYGICMFSTHYAIPPHELAKACEERGFESLWLPEHTHIPADRMGPDGKPLPEEYWHTYDPFVALAAAAMATKKLKIGTGVCLVIERDPITTAKEVASLDHLSNGRFLFGVGAGWNKEEMGNHGTAYATRYRLLKDRIQAMKAIWTQDEASYKGEFVKFGPLLSYPKPVQKPHPPIFLGGNGAKALEAVADYCDGWFPLGFFTTDFATEIARLREKRPMEVSVFGVKPDETTIQQLADAGVSRAIFRVPAAPADKVLPKLDQYSKLAHR